MNPPTVPAMCYVVGNIMKQIPQVPNWTIPVALPFVGAMLSVVLHGWNPAWAMTGFMDGASAVGLNELATRTIGATLTKK